jgi:hypothetical protein
VSEDESWMREVVERLTLNKTEQSLACTLPTTFEWAVEWVEGDDGGVLVRLSWQAILPLLISSWLYR